MPYAVIMVPLNCYGLHSAVNRENDVLSWLHDALSRKNCILWSTHYILPTLERHSRDSHQTQRPFLGARMLWCDYNFMKVHEYIFMPLQPSGARGIMFSGCPSHLSVRSSVGLSRFLFSAIPDALLEGISNNLAWLFTTTHRWTI